MCSMWTFHDLFRMHNGLEVPGGYRAPHSSATPNTHILMPSGIIAFGVEDWVTIWRNWLSGRGDGGGSGVHYLQTPLVVRLPGKS